MARLRTIGCEVGVTTDLSAQDARIDPTIGFAPDSTLDTSVKRSGLSSLKLSTGSPATANECRVRIKTTEIGAVPVTSFFRAYFRFGVIPPATIRILTAGTTGTVVDVRITSTGQLGLFVGAVQQGSLSAALSVDTWYRVEMSLTVGSGATDGAELRLDGVSVASIASQNWTDTACIQFDFGWQDGWGVDDQLLWLDDIAFNDSTGSSQNSWPGEGSVVLLKPISDNQRGSWTGGAGGTTNLWEAVNNTPPIGTATETDLTQIESADSSPDNSTDEYRANMTDYSTAGVGPADTVTLCQAVVDHGEDVATGTKTGSFLILSNPAQSVADTFTFGDDVGALGTWSSNWRAKWGAAQYAPSVTLGTSPVLRIRKTDTGTRVASCDFMGIYVEYTSPAAQEGAISPFGQIIASVEP